MERRTKGPMYKMKGTPMQRNFGIGSPLTEKTDPPAGSVTFSSIPTDQDTMGSTQEQDLDRDTSRNFVDDQGRVYSSKMLRLKKMEPEDPKSKKHRSWQRAFNIAQDEQVAKWKAENEGSTSTIDIPR